MAAASYSYDDRSGPSSNEHATNPYQTLIDNCNDDSVKISQKYALHRSVRCKEQADRVRSAECSGVIVDDILARLCSDPEYVDTRNCLVFWARPPEHIKRLIACIQDELRKVAPSIWLMPQDNLHMTVLEITHSRTPPEIDVLVKALDSSKAEMTDYTLTHRARLNRPRIVWDSRGVALSFLPASENDQTKTVDGSLEGVDKGEGYTYHHLRRDMHDMALKAGVEVASRYVVPSAHLTIARFIDDSEFLLDGAAGADGLSGTKVVNQKRLIEMDEVIARMNGQLDDGVLPADGKHDHDSLRTMRRDWLVGQDKGLDFRKGTLWYGAGETIRLGAGFESE